MASVAALKKHNDSSGKGEDMYQMSIAAIASTIALKKVSLISTISRNYWGVKCPFSRGWYFRNGSF